MKQKHRTTSQRKIILEELSKLVSHPTADELYNIVKIKSPKISLGTVYRNLDFLSQSGRIKKLDLMGSRKRFDGKTGEHYHLRCRKCKNVFDLPIEPIAEIKEAIENVTNNKIEYYSLEFFGLCQNCK